jgi:hypothetical protein
MQTGHTIGMGSISATALLVMKTVQNEVPKPLFDLVHENYFEESRKPSIDYFFDNSKTQLGQQSIQKRSLFMRYVTDPWNDKLQPLTDDAIRVIANKSFLTTIPL